MQSGACSDVARRSARLALRCLARCGFSLPRGARGAAKQAVRARTALLWLLGDARSSTRCRRLRVLCSPRGVAAQVLSCARASKERGATHPKPSPHDVGGSVALAAGVSSTVRLRRRSLLAALRPRLARAPTSPAPIPALLLRHVTSTSRSSSSRCPAPRGCTGQHLLLGGRPQQGRTLVSIAREGGVQQLRQEMRVSGA